MNSKLKAFKDGFLSGLESIIAEMTFDHKAMNKVKEIETKYVGSYLEKYYNIGDLAGNISLLVYLVGVPYLSLMEPSASILGTPFLAYLIYKYLRR